MEPKEKEACMEQVSEESADDLTGIHNPLNKIEQHTDTRNPIIRFLERFGDLFVLNLIFILSCLPLITIGAAFTALFTITNQMIRNEDGNLWQSYWKAFFKNFKPGTILWILACAYLYVFRFVYSVMIHQTGTTANIFIGVLGLMLVVFTFTFPLLFPMVARYENSIWNYLKNSFIVSIVELKAWFTITVMWFVPIFVFLAKPIFFVYMWYLWALIMCSASAYGTSLTMEKVYRRLEHPKDEEKNNHKNEKMNNNIEEQKNENDAKGESHE